MQFVILSNQRFNSPLKTNKWHVAVELAKLGHVVIFIDPPIRFRKVIKLLLTGHINPRDLLFGYSKISEYLYVFMPVTFSPTEKPNLFWFNYGRLKNLLNIRGIKENGFVLWVYHQVMTQYIDKLRYRTLVYDCVDEYSKFPNYVARGLAEYVSKAEEYVARKADLVFATTEFLVKKMKRFNRHVFFTPNVGDYERFKIVGTGKIAPAKELLRIDKPIIGFAGAIDEYKVNLGLIEKCAKSYPNYSFVLVGPCGISDKNPNISTLMSTHNIHFLGEKPYERMPEFFEGFSAFIIPYNLNEYTLEGCFPVKFHDALSAGLPVIVTDLPPYKVFSDVCYIAEKEEDFVTLLNTALKDDSILKKEERKKVAAKNSYDVKVKLQLGLINKFSKS